MSKDIQISRLVKKSLVFAFLLISGFESNQPPDSRCYRRLKQLFVASCVTKEFMVIALNRAVEQNSDTNSKHSSDAHIRHHGLVRFWTHPFGQVGVAKGCCPINRLHYEVFCFGAIVIPSRTGASNYWAGISERGNSRSDEATVNGDQQLSVLPERCPGAITVNNFSR